MKDGFVKVAAATPEIRVADCNYNADKIIEMIAEAERKQVDLLVFPELCVTGYTAGDLFYTDTLLDGAKAALTKIAEATNGIKTLIFVGLPVKCDGKVYNCAAAISDGDIIALIPKKNLPNYNEFYEKRWFEPAGKISRDVEIGGRTVRMEEGALFAAEGFREFTVGVELCEDLWVADSPSIALAKKGANIIVNLSASDETVGKAEYRCSLVSMQSAKLVSGYVYADAGDGESTTDLVFSGHNIIAENGKILKESNLFENGMIISEIDVKFLDYERRKLYPGAAEEPGFAFAFFPEERETELTRKIDSMPFVPECAGELDKRAELILNMQARGLVKRVRHTSTGAVVVGVSGGLDSCLALLVCIRAFKILERPLSDVVAISMPCFGTTQRTKSNAQKLAELTGVTFRTIDIKKSVARHLADIGRDESVTDVTYENAQARERTQVLMDVANSLGGMVIGTGDLSELALGWATYNGDHMSMYGVNASVPKTLVRHLVRYEADNCGDKKLAAVLRDILATPVSPELLPAKDGEIAQKTEDIVGPYELHDFFLYNFVRNGFGAGKIYRLACLAFRGKYSPEVVEKWLRKFISRFFSQQFKRSCLPDGVKVGSVTLSPRGDWRMPSDACRTLWEAELDEQVSESDDSVIRIKVSSKSAFNG